MIHPLRNFYYPANLVALKAFPDTSLSLIDNILTLGLSYLHARLHKILLPWTNTAAEEQTSEQV